MVSGALFLDHVPPTSFSASMVIVQPTDSAMKQIITNSNAVNASPSSSFSACVQFVIAGCVGIDVEDCDLNTLQPVTN